MNFEKRQTLTILQTFGIAFIGAIVAHKISHAFGLAVSGMSVALSAASYMCAQKDKSVKLKNNLFFLTRAKLKHLNIGMGIFLGTLVLVVSHNTRQMLYGGSIAANILLNISFLYLSERALAKKALTFEEFSNHPMIFNYKNQSIKDIDKNTILDWISHEQVTWNAFWQNKIEKEKLTTYGEIYEKFKRANIIQDVDGHLSITSNDVHMLKYEDNHYVWYADSESYQYFMLILLAFEIEKAIKQTDMYEITGQSAKPGEILNWMKRLSKNYPEISPNDWWESLVIHDGNLPAIPSDEVNLFI